MTARVVPDLLDMAMRALLHVAAEHCRTTDRDRCRSFAQEEGQGMPLQEVGQAGLEDVA